MIKNIIFDMETGDPDDLITLLLLLNNPQVNLKAVTCYEGSSIQIGLINYIISLSDRAIPIGGWNTEDKRLNDYYYKVVGNWKPCKARTNPIEILTDNLDNDTILLTGAPLTNIAQYLKNNNENIIYKMVTQGGYLGDIVPEYKRLEKFKKRKSIRTYNLSNDTDAFETINNSINVKELTFVTKDLCHGFLYEEKIYSATNFKNNKIAQLLKASLQYYVEKGVKKAMHDPLAMLFMLNPLLCEKTSIDMKIVIEKEQNKFFSIPSNNDKRFGVIDYDVEKTWNYFKEICEY